MKETGNTCKVFGPEIEAFLKASTCKPQLEYGFKMLKCIFSSLIICDCVNTSHVTQVRV